jgi:hypothetical protein
LLTATGVAVTALADQCAGVRANEATGGAASGDAHEAGSTVDNLATTATRTGLAASRTLDDTVVAANDNSAAAAGIAGFGVEKTHTTACI